MWNKKLCNASFFRFSIENGRQLFLYHTRASATAGERHVNTLDRLHYPMTTEKARALIIEHTQATFPSHLIASERR